MGHGYPGNLSRFFVRRLYAKGKLSIKEATEAAIKAGEKAEAGEGDYEGPEMVSHFFELIISFLRCHRGPRTEKYPQGEADPVIVPVEPLTEAQSAALAEFDSDDYGGFGSYDDPETVAFDSIRWKYAPGWRAKYPDDLPCLDYVVN